MEKINIDPKKKGDMVNHEEINEIVSGINSTIENLDTKAGCFYYDMETNRYLVFADEDARDEYLETGEASLLLGAFDAPYNYTAEIKMESATYNTVALNSTGNTIKYTFDVLNKSGASTGEGVTATYVIRNGNVSQTITQKYRSGQEVEFNVDEYLKEGTNVVRVTITSTDTLASTSMAITYLAVNLSLSTDFDISQVIINDAEDTTMEVGFTISGTGVKTLHFFIDGEEQEFNADVDEVLNSSVTRTRYIPVHLLADGLHRLQINASVNINGEQFFSPSLFRDFITRNTATAEDVQLVALSLDLDNPSGKALTGDEVYLAATQYVEKGITFACYDPTSPSENTVDIIAEDGEGNQTTLSSVTTHNGEVTTYNLVATSTEWVKLHLSPVATELSTAEATIIPLSVSQLDIDLAEITDGLQLALDAKSKSNEQTDKDTWEYGSYKATFDGVKWTDRSGWNNGVLRLYQASMAVNLAPLATNPATKGKTLEFEFTTENVIDDDEVICDLLDESTGAGLIITASEIRLVSDSGNVLSRRYKNGEYVRVGFVINKSSGVTNKKLVFVYINGINSGAMAYATGEKFISSKQLTFSAQNSALLLRSIRIYDTALSDENMLNNYMLYRTTATEMLSLYDKNDIYEEGTTTMNLDKLANQLPVLIITGDIPTLENTTNKKETIVVDAEYINVQDPSRSFKLKNAAMTPQGTSSMSYPKKNFRLYTQKRDDTILYDADGNVVTDRLYSFKSGAIPVNCWCFKADYAESSGTHNTGIARLWNEVMKNAQIDGEYLLRTQAQQAAIDNGYAYDVRTAIDGFPILMFYRPTENDDPIFIGKYNFNNDKSTEAVFGFKDIPNFDNSNVQCFEFLNNGHHLCLFQDVLNFDAECADAWESRYPDTKTPDYTALKRLATWLASTKGDAQKFEDELSDYFDIPKLAAYYIYLMRFGAVDQTVKNAMLETEDGVHWFFINYDNDTVNGLRNDGPLKYLPTITRQTLDTDYATEVYAYAGHDSTLWNNFEASSLCMTWVRRVDEALYTAGLSVANAISMFNDKQSAMWNERIYNQDSQYKYISPYVDKGTNNLFMLQGSRASHRAWWLYRRFSLYDSLFVTGDYKNNNFEIKVAGAPIGVQFGITSGYDGYYGYGVNNDVIESGHELARGESVTWATKQVLNVGDPLRIYMAPNIQAIDVHNFAPYLSTIYMGGVNVSALGSQLKKLTLGSTELTNTALSDISGLTNAVYLEELNIQGYEGITALDLSNMKYLKALYANGSGLRNLELASGAPIETLELPSGIQNLALKGLDIAPSGLTFEDDGKALNNIYISNCPQMKSDSAFLLNWYANKTTADENCSVDVEIDWTDVSVSQLLALGQIKANGGSLRLRGKVTFSVLTYEQALELMEIFGTNCFEKSSEFYIDAPTALYLVGPTSISAGQSGTFKVVAIGELTDKKLLVQGDLPTGVSVDTANGIVSVGRTFYSGTLKLYATAKNSSGQLVNTDVVSVAIKGLTDISTATIEGETTVRSTAIPYSVVAKDSDAEYTVEWSLSSTTYATLTDSTSLTCKVSRSTQPTNDTSVTLTAKLTSESGKTISTTKTITIGGLIDISSATISGDASTRKTAMYSLAINPTEIETTFETTWALSGNAVTAGYASLGDNDNNACLVVVSSLPASGDSTCTLTATIKTSASKTVTATYSISILEALLEQPEENGNIQLMIKADRYNTYYIIVGSTSGFTIDWGDGTIEDITVTNSNTIGYKHTYASARNYNVEISNCEEVEKFGVYPSYLLAFWSVGDSKVTSLSFNGQKNMKAVGTNIFKNDTTRISFDNVFYNCWSLVSIPEGLFDNCTSVTNFNNAFYGCSALTSIPENLFTNNPLVTTFEGTFYNCSSLTSIPSGLFDNCTSVTSFSATFYNCSSLTSIPSGLFDNCTSVTSFSATFYNCSSLTSIPSGLFDNNTAVVEFNGTFENCVKLTSIPSGLFNNCLNVTTFGKVSGITYNGTFYNCSNLTSIPKGLFDNCTKVTNFSSTFYGCTSLTSIPSGLFDNCTSVTTFSYTFGKCSKLASIPEGLFDKCTAVTNFEFTFSVCSSLTEIPSGLFKNHTLVTTFEATFSRCSKITSIPSGLFDNCPLVKTFRAAFTYFSGSSIPEGLFDNCTSVTNFNNTFYGCSALTSIPENLFTNNPLVITFEGTFCDCTSLASIPSGLFDKNTAVTDFSSTFRGCSVLTSIPENLFTNNPLVITFEGTFYNCTSLTSIPSVLFDNCTSVTNFSSTFRGCSVLTSIPSGLFDNNTSVITFSYTFYSCSSLTKCVYQSAPKCISWSSYTANDTKLTTVVITDTQAPNTDVTTAFSSSIANITFYVPDDMVDTYKAATNWTAYADNIKPLSEYTGD